MHAQFTRSLLSLLATACVVCTASADPVIPMNQGIETSSSEFVLPSSDTGNIFFNSCSGGCTLNSLRLTPATRYVIGKLDVSRQELDRFMHKGGPYFVMIFRDIKEPTVVKIVVHAEYRPANR